MAESGKVGIVGIGTANSVGFDLGVKLYHECSRFGLPSGLFLYNRPPKNKDEPDKSHSFLEKMYKDISANQLKKEFGVPKQGAINDTEDCGKSLDYDRGKCRMAAKACPSLDNLLEETDNPSNAVVFAVEAAKGWYEWLQQAPPREKMKIRQYLFSHNLSAAVEFGEALRKYSGKAGHPHQAHRIIITNPCCRINDAIRIVAGDAAGPAGKSTAYSHIDLERNFEHFKLMIKERFPLHKFEIRNDLTGRIENPIRFVFKAGNHAENIRLPESDGGDYILNSLVLWSAIHLGGIPFNDAAVIYSEKYGYDISKLKEEIEKKADSELIKELKKYNGRTTPMIIPSLAEIVLDILSNKESNEDKRPYSMGTVFKFPGTEKEFTFVWPVVYRDGYAWPFVSFEDLLDISKNTGYISGNSPKVLDFGFVRRILSADETAKCNQIAQSMEDSLEETKTFVENKKERENFIDLHRNIFVITEKVELPPQERRISLLMESCNEFADSASFDTNESYRQALEIASRQAYTIEDIILVSKRLGEFSGHDRFNSIGFYLSALINHIANPGDSLQFDFRYLDEMKGKNKDLKFLDGIGAFNRSADLGVKGILGNQAGYHFAGGSLKGDSAGNYTAEEQEAGIITFNKILHYGGTCKSGGELIVAEAGDSLGYRMKNNGIIKAVSAHDCLGEEIAGGLVEAETAKDEVGKRGKKGVIRLLKSYSSLADDIGKEVKIYCGNARVR